MGEVDIVEKFGLHVVDLASKLFAEVAEGYNKFKDLNMCSLKLSTDHHPETEGLAERSIPTLEGIIRRSCAFGMT